MMDGMWELPRPLGRWVGARFLEEGGKLPRGYGIAWACPYSHRFYCLPVPLHRIAGSFRAFYIEFRRPCEDDPVNAAYQYGRSEGFEAGARHGEERAARLNAVIIREIKAEVAALRELWPEERP